MARFVNLMLGALVCGCLFGCRKTQQGVEVHSAAAEKDFRVRMQKLAQMGQDPMLEIESEMRLAVFCRLSQSDPDTYQDGASFALFLKEAYRSETSQATMYAKAVLFRQWEETSAGVRASLSFYAGEVLGESTETDALSKSISRTFKINGWRKSPQGVFLDGFIEHMSSLSCNELGCRKLNKFGRLDGIKIRHNDSADEVLVDGYNFQTSSQTLEKYQGICTTFDG